jgi:soluble lytic murein transglycosylase-like protein
LQPNNEKNVKRLAALSFLLLTVNGCGAGGFLPNSAHSMDAVTLRQIVAQEARRTGVSPKILTAVIKTESGGDPSAISSAGAQGLMQLMPATSLTYGVINPFDPAENTAGGASYLRDLLKRYHKNVRLALAAYDAGPATVDAAKGIPNFLETKAYVARVIAFIHSSP